MCSRCGRGRARGAAWSHRGPTSVGLRRGEGGRAERPCRHRVAAKEKETLEVEKPLSRCATLRFSLSGTGPPLRGRKVTATPYALRLLPRRRPPIPPLLVPASNPPDPDRPPDVGPLPRTPPPLLPLAHTPARHAHTRQTRRPALKRKRKKQAETSGGDSPPCKPQFQKTNSPFPNS